MRTHTTYDSDKLLCILRSVSPTCDNNEADPYAYMWIWDKERNLWLYILGFSSDYGANSNLFIYVRLYSPPHTL